MLPEVCCLAKNEMPIQGRAVRQFCSFSIANENCHRLSRAIDGQTSSAPLIDPLFALGLTLHNHHDIPNFENQNTLAENHGFTLNFLLLLHDSTDLVIQTQRMGSRCKCR
jgi:hypothetical protein